MKFTPTPCRTPRGKPALAGFTLAEVLAALLFMAIVIPVAMQGLRIANLSGQVAERKSMAARLGQNLLSEVLVTGQQATSTQGGTVEEGPYQFRWQMRNETWDKEALRLVSIDVTFAVQGRDYDVRLSTLMDPAQP